MSKFVILNQIVYQDYHTLVTTINENGHLYTFICLGGQGSSKKQTGRKLELGYVIEVQAFSENSKLKKLYLKEFDVLFSPKLIRNNYNIWCVLNFILELTQRTISEKDLTSSEWALLKNHRSTSHEYELLVKYLFLLENFAKDGVDKYFSTHLCLFYMIKTMLVQGTLPNFEQCSTCRCLLSIDLLAHFEGTNFYCKKCAPGNSNAGRYWSFLVFSKQSKFIQLKESNVLDWKTLEPSSFETIFDQNFSLLGLSKKSIRSYTLISQ